jgi:hypothetical protein
MKISILLLLIAIILSIPSVLAINPGHPANQIEPGYFAIGDYVFPGNVAASGAIFGVVGIGETNPQSPLQVNAVIRLGPSTGAAQEGNITNIDRLIGNNDIFILGNPTETAPVYLSGSNVSLYTNKLQRLTIDTSGNVGIGTATPGSALDVNGVIIARNGLTVSSGTVSLPANQIDSSEVNFNYAGSSSKGGAATTATALAANGANCAAGNYPLGVDASGNVESCTSVGTGGITGSGTLGYIPMWNSTSSLNNSVIYQSAGNVGIGTTPTEKLDVNGAIRIGNTATSNAGTIRWTGSDFQGYNGTAWVSLTSGAGGGGIGGSGTATQLAFFIAASTISSDSNLYWDNSNKRLGIGESNPQSPLQVNAVIRLGPSSGTTEGNITNIDRLIGYNDMFILGNPTETAPVYLSGSNVSLYTNKLQRLTVDITGNLNVDSNTFYVDAANNRIGINTASPARTLQIAGTDGMRLNPSALPGSPAAGDIAVDSTGNNILKWYNGTTWISAGGGGGGGGGTLNCVERTSSAGNSIVTVSCLPSETVHNCEFNQVSGGCSYTSMTATATSCTFSGLNCAMGCSCGQAEALCCQGGGGAGGGITGSGTTGYIPMWNGTSSLNNSVIVQSGGNIGIGKTPTQALDVNGVIVASNGLTVSAGTVSLPANQIDSTEVNFNYAGSSSKGGAATTATALAANGANCAAGQYAQGVSASGAAEGCTALTNSQWTTSGSNIYYNTGNVGIGTTTPSSKLYINASGNAKETIEVTPQGQTGTYTPNWNAIEICQFGTCCPPWKNCDGDGATYAAGTDCDEGCPTCYVGSGSFTLAPDGRDQNCNGQVDEATTLTAYCTSDPNVWCLNQGTGNCPLGAAACNAQCAALGAGTGTITAMGPNYCIVGGIQVCQGQNWMAVTTGACGLNCCRCDCSTTIYR